MGGGNHFYQVLGLNKECSEAELKNAYKKLALKWHPDRCSASGNFKYVEESKKKFQAIQEAYSVLSDVDKRFLYDVGVYDSDDEGMADFMNEMAVMMTQNKPNGNGESFEELKDLFEEMFQSDIDSFGSTSQTRSSTCYSSSLFSSCGESSSSSSSNKRGSSAISNTKTEDSSLGVEDTRRGAAWGGRGDMRNANANASKSLFEGHSCGSNLGFSCCSFNVSISPSGFYLCKKWPSMFW